MSPDPLAGEVKGLDAVTQQAIIEAITKGGAGPLWSILANSAQMPAEQRAILTVLQGVAAHEGAESDDDDDDEIDDPAPRRAPRRMAGARAARSSSSERELSDLREVNDTLASALGACRVCWGGDGGCSNCGGRGHPGSSLPESRLFDALILPAVRRVHGARRTRVPGRNAGSNRLSTLEEPNDQ